MDDIFEFLIVIGVSYIIFRYIIPFIWNKLVVPLGKLAYFLILLLIGFTFYFIIFLADESIPQNVKILIGLITALIAGYKWAISKKI